MFKSDSTTQPSLFAFTPRDLLPDDSDVWLYCDLFDQLELEEFYFDYVSQGEEAIDPKLMLRTIFYGLTHGATSGRKLESVCRYDARYMVLCGGYRPHFRTFHRFLVRHDSRFAALFVQVVRLAMAMKLVKLGRLAIDGTRLRANTAQQRTMKYEKMQKAIDKITQELADLKKSTDRENAEEATAPECTLPDEIKMRESRLASIMRAKALIEAEAAGKGRDPLGATQKSFHDVDAILMSDKNAFLIGYNGQVVADEHSQIVVAAEVYKSTNDAPLLPDMLTQVEKTCGSDGQAILADGGYLSAANVMEVEMRGSDPIFGNKKEQGCAKQMVADETKYEQVVADPLTNTYQCLAGKPLPPKGKRSNDGLYIAISDEFCRECPFQGRCRIYPQRNQKKIGMALPKEWMALRRHYERSRLQRYKDAYKQRKAIVEPVFGNLKWNKKLRLSVTGIGRASSWWKMVCTAHNIEKIIGFLFSRWVATREIARFLVLLRIDKWKPAMLCANAAIR